jgi:hypothetical protein
MSLIFLMSLACGADDDCTSVAWFLDADGDGHGGTERVDACQAPAGYVAQSTDCDDHNDAVHPDADELCDTLDNDCDGTADNDPVDALTFYADADGDGFGDASAPTLACALGEGLSEDDTDCDDTEPSVNPGAQELCDGLDNDCDASTTEGLSYPGDFESLSEAVDLLQDGDQLCIQAGTYSEAMFWSDKQLHLAGAGADQTILLAETQGQPGVSMRRGDGSTLSGLTVRGLQMVKSADVVVQDTVLTGGDDCTATCGRVILEDAQATFNDVDVTEVLVIASAGAGSAPILALAEGSALSWNGGRFADNTIDGGTDSASRLDVAGAIQVYESSLHTVGVAMDDNTTTVDQITHGSATTHLNYKGLIEGFRADVLLQDGSVSGNGVRCTARNDQGDAYTTCYGGWLIQRDATLEMSGMVVADNVVDASGTTNAYGTLGDLYDATVTFTDVVFQSNAVSNDGASGSVAMLSHVTAPADLLRVQFLDNEVSADAGGMIGLVSNVNGELHAQNVVMAYNDLSGVDVGYGLIRVSGADLTLLNSTVHENKLVFARAYAGVAYHSGSSFTYLLRNNSFSRNQLGVTDATSLPAAAVLWAYATRTIDYNSFYGNSSPSGILATNHSSEIDVMSGTGNGALTPDYVDPEAYDFSLGGASQMTDAGSPEIEDTDGSRSDMGASGGPEAQ